MDSVKTHDKSRGPSSNDGSDIRASAAPPPAMEEASKQTADELLEYLNRTPLFMTELDDSDGAGGENVELEALKALAYEGTPAEVAANFKAQGNDCVKSKKWMDAREFYDRALTVLSDKSKKDALTAPERLDEVDVSADIDLSKGDSRQVIDLEQEERQRKEIEEQCHVNRAFCNLELQNYGSCIRDCASTLQLNPRNVKAYYRSSTACLALNKYSAAVDACERALALDPHNSSTRALSVKIHSRKAIQENIDKERRERCERQVTEVRTLQEALKSRNIRCRTTKEAPGDMEDARIMLSNPLDSLSTLSIPVILLYPTAAQSDMIKSFQERNTILDHLSYIFPCPWDSEGEFAASTVECFVQTIQGGLIKLGKKVILGKLLSERNVEITDGIVRIFVVPKIRANAWISEYKARMISEGDARS